MPTDKKNPDECPEYNTIPRAFWKMEYPFIVIIHRSTLTRNGSICSAPLYELNKNIHTFTLLKTIQLFAKTWIKLGIIDKWNYWY